MQGCCTELNSTKNMSIETGPPAPANKFADDFNEIIVTIDE
jgi:hypothetical protein